MLASLGQAREKAKIARVQEELFNIRNAVQLLVNDTGKLPCGCPLYAGGEISLNDPRAGLREGTLFDGTACSASDLSCHWDLPDQAKWHGPYVAFDLVDPWGKPYMYDGDYSPFANRKKDINGAVQESCPNASPEGVRPVLFSFGPTPYPEFNDPTCFNPPGNCYTCREVFIEMP